MKKLLLIIAIAFIGMKANAQFPKPVLTNISQTQVYLPNSLIHTFYCNLAAGGANALAYIQYNTVEANLGSGPSFALGSVSATFTANINMNSPVLLPNKTYYWRILASNAFGNVYSTVQNFTTLSSATISNISSSSISDSTASINYTLKATNGLATTSIIKWGTSPANLLFQVTGGNASGSSDVSTSADLNGLNYGGTFYYQIVATNSLGTTSSAVYAYTHTDPAVALAEYSFDNTYANVSGTYAFLSNSGTSFVNDRQGNPNKALNINQSGSSTIIVGLPAGSSPRTVSIWAKFNGFSVFGYNHLYGYGTAGTGTANGGTLLVTDITNGTGASLGHLGYADNHTEAVVGYNFRNWNHFVFVYDGTSSKVYLNGTLFGTTTKSWNTIVTSSNFTIGSFMGETFFDGALDDLKIYNRALNATEITNLYINNSILATQNFQVNTLKATIYPNPTTDILNISMDTELKSVEIYNLLGQKIMTSSNKHITISNLSKGIYTVRIENVENAVATQKLIVK